VSGEPMVRIRGVSRRFPGGHYGVRGVTLDVARGETLVIMGPSGSGKSTLLRCVNGLETLDEGEIIIDGMRVNHDTTDWNKVREEVGMVFQGFHLFPNRTALMNLVLPQTVVRRRPAAEAERNARALLERVGLQGKESRLPSELSGGEKQRVAIARALLKSPRILIFDEATSALDSRSEKAIQAELERIAQGRTTLVIAHRLSTVMDADQILVLNHGRIVERGAHQQLLELKGEYARMWALQQQQAEAKAVLETTVEAAGA